MRIDLRIVAGPMKGKKISFDEYQRLSIGRGKGNFLSFPEDKRLSKNHCLIEILPPHSLFVGDLDSTNGTFVGQKNRANEISYYKISNTHLQNGDYLKVGKTVIQFRWETNDKKIACSKCGETITLPHNSPNSPTLPHNSPNSPAMLCSRCKNKEQKVYKRLGSFEIIRKLGEGGMGVVYLMRHRETQYLYAVKIAFPRLVTTNKQRIKFLREAASGMEIKHPHIVRYYEPEYIEEEDYFIIPMEYFEGVNFLQYLLDIQRPLTVAEITPPLYQLLDALATLHAKGIVHRDIKPSNILVAKKDRQLWIKLADFGLAKSYEEAGLSGLTLSHQAQGTPYYMAPEQCNNACTADPRADIYAVAATLYHLLTGKTIYHTVASGYIYYSILNEKPVPIWQVNPQIPREFGQIIMQCLEKKRRKRIQTVAELERRCKEVLPG